MELLKIGEFAFAQLASGREDDPVITYATLADRDGDGIADRFERRHGLDPTDPTDADADLDADGYSNLSEFLSGTDPTDAGSTPARLPVQLGRANIGQAWRTVPWNADFPATDPLVFAGPATNNDPFPGIATLSNVSGQGFRLRYRNLSPRDGAHGEETVSYLALNPGRYPLPDGAIWEAGSFDLPSAETWYRLRFLAAMPNRPALYLGIQTADYGGIARARSVTEDGFGIIVNRLESSAGMENVHVAYLAVYHPSGGSAFDFSGVEVTYTTQSRTLDHRVNADGGVPLRLDPAQYGSDYQGHAPEQADILEFRTPSGTIQLVQSVSATNSEPTTPRIWSIADGDADGIPDVQEIRFGTNPRDDSDAAADSDSDGVRNFMEILLGTDPFDPSDTPDPKRHSPRLPDDSEAWWSQQPLGPGVRN